MDSRYVIYSVNLPQRRAESVVKYLESKGIPKGQLIPIGKGWDWGAKWPECKPASVCPEWKNEENRRIVFKLMDEGAEVDTSKQDQTQ